MILSRQSIVEYMRRKEDPLEVYVLEGWVKKNIDPSSIYSHSIDLHLGSKIAEVDVNELIGLLIQEKGIDEGLDTILEGGLNPIAHKEIFNKAKRILDLRKLKSYRKREISSGIFEVYDDNYTFQTKVIQEDDKVGIVLHPEIYSYRQFMVNTLKSILSVVDTVSSYIRDGDKEKALMELNLLKDKIRESTPTPSSSFILVQTKEIIKMPRDLVGEIHTKSKLARKGLSVHPSSGKVDAGFHNYLVLEIKNQGILPLALFEGDALAELQFSKLDRPTELPYRERKNSSFKSLEFLV
mgnify:FL=1